MKMRFIFVYFLYFIFFNNIVFSNSNKIYCEDEDISVLIQKIYENTESWTEYYHKFRENPSLSVGCLISQLETVDPKIEIGRSKGKDFPRELYMVNIIQTLQYITGLKMRVPLAGVSKKYKDTNKVVEQSFFHEHSVPFFWLWMSRSRIYFAPKFVQIEIIKMWKIWYKTESHKYRYPKRVDVQFWGFH